MTRSNTSASRLDTDAQINAQSRQRSLDELAQDEFDVLVVGGGIVGTGAALEASSRGLRTGLIEARDFSDATSSRSSKLVHGGIRYLEQLNFSLVHEALLERGLLMRTIAPHLVKPIRFLYPLRRPVFERLYVGAGMFLYDLFARTTRLGAGVDHHRHVTRRQLGLAMPGLRKNAFAGGLVYWDAQVDDSRYLITLARTAQHFGARLASRVRMTGLIREGERVVGVHAVDEHTQQAFEIRAKRVVVATGVWSGEVLGMLEQTPPFRVRTSKGVHIMVDKRRIPLAMGLLLRTPSSVLFVIDWGRHWLIGTTDTSYEGDLRNPTVDEADVDYLLTQLNQVLEHPLTRDDVTASFAGLRPLLEGESEETSKLSREHQVAIAAPGLVVVAGGKWTTYRVMAQDAIDAALLRVPGESSETSLQARAGGSVSERTALLGADGYYALSNNRGQLATQFGLSEATVTHLLNRYGSLARELLALIERDRELAQPVAEGSQYLRAEVIYAITHEGALHLDDVLFRRLRLGIEDARTAVAACDWAASAMAQQLGWSAVEKTAEISAVKQLLQGGAV